MLDSLKQKGSTQIICHFVIGGRMEMDPMSYTWDPLYINHEVTTHHAYNFLGTFFMSLAFSLQNGF